MFQKMIYRTTLLFVEQMDFFFPQRIAGRHVKASLTSRVRSLSRNTTPVTVASNCCLISYFDARKFWCIFVHAIFRIVSEIFKKALKVQILNEVALKQMVRKRRG